ncbi:YdeI/OmpD-associated family protein [Membranihabitans marinus]|uniref:YdeI/OmpD-associated family protein n=2 Tax=Nesterenkonia rhizosphaerae TaxID=1348272 RepID=A0ABP9G1R5_9MICC
MSMGTEPEVLVLKDAAAWRIWLDEHEDSHDGVWLILAKKGTTSPTSLSYAQALDEALCSGWIDGQRRSYDEVSYLQRFTPRRARSIWSKRNVEYIQRLREAGRMRPRGEHEVSRAQADGRWDRAYEGPATAVVPEDLRTALDSYGLVAYFESLNSQERYSLLHPLMTATSDKTRAARLQRIVDRLREASASGG